MRNIVLFFALSLLTMPLFGQYSDDFESNRLGWNEVAYKNRSAIIQNGKMHLESKSDTATVLITAYAPVDPDLDFEMKCDAAVSKIEDGKYFGMVLDYKDDMNYTRFLLTADRVMAERYVEGRKTGSRHDNLKKFKSPKGATAVLAVRKKGDSMSLYVNDVKTIEVPWPATNRGFGFCLIGKQAIDFDNLEIIQ